MIVHLISDRIKSLVIRGMIKNTRLDTKDLNKHDLFDFPCLESVFKKNFSLFRVHLIWSNTEAELGFLGSL